MNFHFYDDVFPDGQAHADPAGEACPEGSGAEVADAAEGEPGPDEAGDRAGEPEVEPAAEEPSEADVLRDRLARLKADFDNYRKRNARDFQESVEKSTGDVLKSFLSPLDNLERAIETMRKTMSEDDPCLKGVLLVQKEVLDALARNGVEPIDTKVGAELDPNLEEALGLVPAPGVAEGRVVFVVRKGYTHRGKVLRAAQVMAAAASGGDNQ